MPSPAFDLGASLPTLDAVQVRLRWLTDADVSALFAIFGDAAVMRYWSHEPLASIDEAREYLEKIRDCFARRDLFQWGVELTATPEIIGTCTLAHLDAEHKRAELGFALARAHWGKGYMREALPALLAFAFGELDLERLTADADPRNHASIGLLEKLGFVREGFLRQHYRLYGEVQDAIILGLLRGEFERRGNRLDGEGDCALE
jgi:[ribosomal protein S5]-alanine N-acetyltransferase